MEFEREVRQAVALLERWEGNDVASVRRAAELYEDLVQRAPDELRSLARLPPTEGVGLWLRLTSLGEDTPAKLIGCPVPAAQRQAIRDAVRRVKHCATSLVRLTCEHARRARSPRDDEISAGAQRSPGRAPPDDR